MGNFKYVVFMLTIICICILINVGVQYNKQQEIIYRMSIKEAYNQGYKDGVDSQKVKNDTINVQSIFLNE